MLFAARNGNLPYISILTQYNSVGALLWSFLYLQATLHACQHSPNQHPQKFNKKFVGLHPTNFQPHPLNDVFWMPFIEHYHHTHDKPIWISAYTPCAPCIKPCLIDFKIDAAKYVFFTALHKDSVEKISAPKKKISSRSNSLLQGKGIPEALVFENFEYEQEIAIYLRNCNPLLSHSFRAKIPRHNSAEQLDIAMHTNTTYEEKIRKILKEHTIKVYYTDLSNSSLLYLACEHGAFEIIPLLLEIAKKQKIDLPTIPRNNGTYPLEALNKLEEKLKKQTSDEMLLKKCITACELLKNFKL